MNADNPNNLPMDITEASLAEDARQLFSNPAVPMCDAVNQLLRRLIGSFKAETKAIKTLAGTETEVYPTVIHNWEEEGAVPIDSVAGVILTYETLTKEVLQEAYQRVAEIKSIQKTEKPAPKGGDTSMTMCAIVSKNSDLSLEQISEEISNLNAGLPSYKWPEAVVVLSAGVINYTATVPSDSKTGDFFLPTESVTKNSPAPSIYVQQTLRASENLSFNKLAGLAIVRVAIFQPGMKLRNHQDFTGNFPSIGLSMETYQFNLSNELVKLSRAESLQQQLPQNSYNIVSGTRKLGFIQFQKWQDGGVLIVGNGFPIDIFLVFLKMVVPNLDVSGMQYFRNKDVQVSYVLPMSEADFLKTLEIFQQRSSNMRIQKNDAKWLVQKISDEGTSSPFVARLMMGIFNTRDISMLDENGKNRFDKLYEEVLSSFRNAREIATDITDLWKEHKEKIDSGKIVNFSGMAVQISESIDRKLKRELENFLNTTGRIIKQNMQALSKEFGTDFGFLFKKQHTFDEAIKELRTTNPVLADYLAATRLWSEPLMLMRNDLEHGVIPSPKVEYDYGTRSVTAREPLVSGRPITEFMADIIDRVACFVEEMTTYTLQQNMPAPLDITEIPLAERRAEAAERFRLTVKSGGSTPWVLTPHTKKFILV